MNTIMKHFTTLLALLLSCSMLAQGPVEFPYNPDSDGDDFIGVNDLMALLGEFDLVFSEEGLLPSEDSLTAMYDAGLLNYIECQKACFSLPGNWKIPAIDEVSHYSVGSSKSSTIVPARLSRLRVLPRR